MSRGKDKQRVRRARETDSSSNKINGGRKGEEQIEREIDR